MRHKESGSWMRHYWEIVRVFLKLGATAYGGPAIMGIMQTELQQKRQWVSKEQFVEGLSLVNMLPGPGATQLGIFLGYARGGWWGGLLAGLCFVFPALLIMLGLTLSYAAYGATPVLQGVLYGLGPVVLGIFAVAVYRLGKTAMATVPQLIIGVAAAILMAFTPLGIVPILLVAGAVGVILFNSRKVGFIFVSVVIVIFAVNYFVPWSLNLIVTDSSVTSAANHSPGLLDISSFFLTAGLFSFGGGLSVIAFIQDHIVNQYQWLTHREFIDGLALGQFTPGPILMIAAYVGYKLAGLIGALVAAFSMFLPAFTLMLSILPVFHRVRNVMWVKAMIKGIGPAVIGVLGVSLLQMAPHAMPDVFAAGIFVITVTLMIFWQIGAVKMMAGGATLGVIKERLGVLLSSRVSL